MATATEPHPTIDYFRNPQYLRFEYSPNGSLAAVLAPGSHGRMNLFVLDLEHHSGRMVTDYPTEDVVQFHWVGNKRLVFSLGTLNEPSGWTSHRFFPLHAVNIDGTYERELGSPALGYFGSIPDSDESILSYGITRSANSYDVYRYNTLTRKHELLSFENPGNVSRWLTDHDGKLRVAVSTGEDLVTTIYYRDTESEPFHEIGRMQRTGKRFLPLGFDYDGRTLYVASDHESDTTAIYRFDPVSKTFGAKVYGRADVDLGVDSSGGPNPASLIFDPIDKALVGISYQAARPGTEWLDPGWKHIQDVIDKALPDTFNAFRPPMGGSKMVVFSYSDRQSGIWYSYDAKAHRLDELVRTRPWLPPEDLVEMQPISYKARDGLEIPAYLFLPKDRAAKDLPLIVDIHGGPWIRSDVWGLSLYGPMEAQFLAAHGYAVLLPNFRGTPGFGRALFAAGYRAWGKGMQDDLEDGMNFLAKEGLVDPKRVCLFGSSYGGYAALEGLAKTPDVYRCGVGALAVTDLVLEETSTRTNFWRSPIAVNSFKYLVGDPQKDEQDLKAVSPAFQASRIKAPILLISGDEDYRVPIEQGQAMKDAMAAVGKTFDWMIFEKESHGFGLVEDRVKEYDAILKFFDDNLAPRASTASN